MRHADDKQTADRVTGTVTSFSTKKGYGFVAKGRGTELFVDQAVVDDDGFYILAIGDRVQYVIAEGSEGPCVSSVRAY
jgi:cold shock protein